MVYRGGFNSEEIADKRNYFAARSSAGITVSAAGQRWDVDVSHAAFGVSHYGIFDGPDLRAYFCVSAPCPPDPPPFFNIGSSVVLLPLRGFAVTRQFIEQWVAQQQTILASDNNQSEAGAGVWESLILRNPRLTFELWDPDTGRTVPISTPAGTITPWPWDDTPSRILALP
jgi:hypothetical protein